MDSVWVEVATRDINSVWMEAATRSGLNVGRGCDKVWEINCVWVEAATRSWKLTQCR